MVSKEVRKTRYRTELVEHLSYYRAEYEYDECIFAYTTKSKPYGSTLKIKMNVSPK